MGQGRPNTSNLNDWPTWAEGLSKAAIDNPEPNVLLIKNIPIENRPMELDQLESQNIQISHVAATSKITMTENPLETTPGYPPEINGGTLNPKPPDWSALCENNLGKQTEVSAVDAPEENQVNAATDAMVLSWVVLITLYFSYDWKHSCVELQGSRET